MSQESPIKDKMFKVWQESYFGRMSGKYNLNMKKFLF